ncbi:hypothetical protein L1887_45008 [Cichorium endivia]|nr:hypothetical protein L1887_45008 [Cichorium endivia]
MNAKISCQAFVLFRHGPQRHDNGHPQRRTQQHDFTSLAIGKAAPEGRGHRGKEKRDAEYQTGPHIERAVARHAKLFDVERQKGHDQAKRSAGKKTAKPRNREVTLPVYGGV